MKDDEKDALATAIAVLEIGELHYDLIPRVEALERAQGIVPVPRPDNTTELTTARAAEVRASLEAAERCGIDLAPADVLARVRGGRADAATIAHMQAIIRMAFAGLPAEQILTWYRASVDAHAQTIIDGLKEAESILDAELQQLAGQARE